VPTSHLPARNTDTPLELPSAARGLTFLSRLLRLRCPHCGNGAVLSWSGTVLDRCSVCGFRFARSDQNYFFGAMFFGVMMGELLFALTFGAIIIARWPDVPWGVMQWALPLGVVLAAPIFIPLSKVVWVSVDVFVRPVTPDELG
jgi:uncharacterized protein (DUF983 family)